MSGRWFDSSRQIFWDNNQQDLTIPGVLETSTANISSIVGDTLTISSISSLAANIDTLTTSSIVINNINNSSAQISSLVSANISSLLAQVGALTTSSIVSNNLSSLIGQISSLITLNISTVQETVNALTASSIVSNNVSSFTSQVSSLTALNMSSLRAQVGALSSLTIQTSSLTAVNVSSFQGQIGQLTTSSIVSNNLSSLIGQISSLITLNISTVQETVNALTASSIVSNNISSFTSQVSSLTALNMSSLRAQVGALSSLTIQTSSLTAVNVSSFQGQIGQLTTSSIVSNNVSSFTSQVSSLIALNISSLREQTGALTTSSIGINCNAPVYRLDVNGNANVNDNLSFAGTPIPDLGANYSALGLLGGNSYGYLYGAFNSLADGIHLSYNHINCNLGTSANGDIRSYIPNTGGRTSQLDLGYGEIGFAVGNSNDVPTKKMFLNSNGLSIINPAPNFSWRTTSTNNAIFTGTVANFNVGSGNFTMECYFNPSATPSTYGTIMCIGTTATGGHEFRIGQRIDTNGFGFIFPTGATTDGNVSLSAANVLQSNVWSHIALVRSTNFAYLYSNGTAILSTNAVSHTYIESKRLFLFSNPYPDTTGQGYINSARFVLGQALYTGNFAPPTQQLTTTAVGTTGPNVAASLTGTVAFLGGVVSTLTDSGPSGLALTVGGSPTSPTSLVFSPGTFIPGTVASPSTLFTCLGSNIGINCNTPQNTLDVNGTTRLNGAVTMPNLPTNNALITSGLQQILLSNTASTYMYMQAPGNRIRMGAYSNTSGMPFTINESGGNVGINCNAPQYQLDVNGQARFVKDGEDILLQGAQNSNPLYITFQKPLGPAYVGWFGNGLQGVTFSSIFGMQTPASTSIAFFPGASAGASPPLFLGSNSRIGILTNTPTTTLDVNGTTRLNGAVTMPSLPENNALITSGAQQVLLSNTGSTYIYMQATASNIRMGSYDASLGARPFTLNELGGNVGVGTTNPLLPLHVGRTVSYTLPAGWQMYYTPSPAGGTGFLGAGLTEGVSIYALGDIWSANRFVVSSDERIKQDITPLSLDSTIQLLQKITPVSYTYKDIMKSKQVHVGFIAQAVEDICPNAISHSSEYIPNINTIVSTITTNSTITTYLEIDSTFLNSSIQFYTPDHTKIQGKIVSISSNSFDTSMDTILPNYSTLLCKGVSVNDFRVLDKEYIFTLNVAATKKLMELVEQQGSTIKSIQEQLSTLQRI